MIGVISKTTETAVVKEFFQLFKTPWEFFRADRSYDVVIATADEIPEVDAGLLLIFGSGIKSSDTQAKITARSKLRDINLSYQGTQVPIYGEALTFQENGSTVPVVTAGSGIAGLKIHSADRLILRLGYDLFREVEFLLSVGQPIEHARIPTLEIHIMMLRKWILDAGITFLEIPSTPAGHSFIVCLTHDIDFVGIRQHKFDHTMWGFLYRSTVGAFSDLVRRRISIRRLLKAWQAAASLPFVYLGWMKDFWVPFDWYLQHEKNIPSTYFLIPFKKRAGDRVGVRHAKRRATAYDITDIPEWTRTLMREGCEIGVHGIDAWHSVDKGREELGRVAAATGASEIGIRMHWLLRDENTFRVLDEAGYSYDSTAGYNETLGYRCGTTQAFRPLGARRLLELPLQIQDGALFYHQRLDLSEPEAWDLCAALIENARKLGGVLTILWHDRSPGPERFWGDFYVKLVHELRLPEVWFGSAGQVVNWFRKRREVVFERLGSGDGTTQVRLRNGGGKIVPPLRVRVHHPKTRDQGNQATFWEAGRTTDVPWTGETDIEIGQCPATDTEFPPKSISSLAE
jgi:hypothetical protein